jgi:stearoyl-CoA desaturase (Delta-9 desaturase)
VPHRRPSIPTPVDRQLLVINLAAVCVPMLALGVAIWYSWGRGFDWAQAALLLGMTIVTGSGVTIGYHRLFTHKSFSTGPRVRWVFAVLGSMAMEGPLIEWAGVHRRHHQFPDQEHDPHSPHCDAAGRSWGSGVRATLRGLYHAHVGWLFTGRQRGVGRYTRDLAADPILVRVNKQFHLWVLVGLLIPAAIGAAIDQSLHGAIMGLLWGGLVRIFVVHHITWSVNSICHIWGTRPFDTSDDSRNNVLVASVAFGEGWHNNHHAFPTSARHGLRWWQFDPSWMVIRTLERVGLAWNVRVPTPERIAAKRRSAPAPAPAPGA